MTASESATLQQNVSLKPFNTLGLDVPARYFSEASSVTDIVALSKQANALGVPLVPLGEGSNVVLSGPLNALVMPIRLMGKSYSEGEGSDEVIVEAAAGESWHPFVQWTLEQGFYGLENLSLIPGTVGAAPIQNIGAYGVEIKDCFHSLDALVLETGEVVTFSLEDCAFGYRDSFFKNKGKDGYVILKVRFRLSRTLKPKLSYGGLQQMLATQLGDAEPSGQDISDAVISTRNSKLPDPKTLGNAGSFFKNPVIASDQAEKLKAEFPQLVMFPVSDTKVKLAAGWLIDYCGFKGYQYQGAAVYHKQALVLVNEAGAEPDSILGLAVLIQKQIKETFGVTLEIEPRVY
ncbi:UDP-N-acetylmuramate dehydrogenase [Spongorhabdus nitratireducens]